MTATVTVLVPVKLAEGITEGQFLKGSDRFHDEFARHQPGLLRRELVRVMDGQYMDIIQFRSMEDAEDIIEKERQSTACQTFFSMIDMSANEESSNLTFYQSLATYQS